MGEKAKMFSLKEGDGKICAVRTVVHGVGERDNEYPGERKNSERERERERERRMLKERVRKGDQRGEKEKETRQV